tara:strand:+ start:1228 stop:1935 length:708 start_codon:yes stop_codon:yes gene_type:complete
MNLENLNSGEIEALTAAKLGDLRKKVNSDSWTDNMEILMKKWGEKAAGLRFMHTHAGGKWKTFSNKLAITGIIVTGVASTLSLIATSIDDDNVKDAIIFGVGGVSLFSTLVQSFKKFYNAEEKAADHGSVARQFGSFYRYMTLQMNMSREDRDPADILTNWALKEYERLQQESPNLGSESINAFKNTFKNELQAIPDIAEDEFIIKIYKPENPDNINIKIPDENVEISSSLNNTN